MTGGGAMAGRARIVVLGCGAMGSVIGGVLAGAGHAVRGVTRGLAHAEAIARDGLRMIGPEGERRVALEMSASAGGDPARDLADLILIATKAPEAAEAARAAVGLLAPGGVVLSIQNGLGAAEEIASVVGPDRLAVGIAAAFGASIPAPGTVRFANLGAVQFGGHGAMDPAALARLAEVLTGAGLVARQVEDVRAMQWEKLICNAAYSGPCAITGLTVGAVMDSPILAPLSQAAAVEAWDVARAAGVALAVDDPVAHVLAFGRRVHAARPSVLQDIERGRPSEIGYINGAVVREAARLGLRAPVNETITALVRHREAGLQATGPRQRPHPHRQETGS